MIAIILDLETTGLMLPSVAERAKQPRIVEVGCIAINEHYEDVRSMCRLVNPEIPISSDATKSHGLKNEDLMSAPKFKEIIPDLYQFFIGGDLLIAHNASFDVGVLQNELLRVGYEEFFWPDIVDSSQEYYSRMGFLPPLNTLYEKIIGVPLKQAHRALDDCEALLEILKKDDFLGRIISR